jgi:hypothetical protein
MPTSQPLVQIPYDHVSVLPTDGRPADIPAWRGQSIMAISLRCRQPPIYKASIPDEGHAAEHIAAASQWEGNNPRKCIYMEAIILREQGWDLSS